MWSSRARGSARHYFRAPWRPNCAIMADGSKPWKRARVTAAQSLERGVPDQVLPGC